VPTAAPSATPPATATAGPRVLAVSGGAPGVFTATLSGTDQVLYTTLEPFTVTDSNGGGAGWHLSVQASALACGAGAGVCPGGGDSLPAGSLAVAPPAVACAAGTPCAGSSAPPSIAVSGLTSIDMATAVRIASASAGSGAGTYVFTPGEIGGVAGRHLQMTLPAYAYAATYSSTVTLSVASGP
jgi:hypothetical protein